MGDFFIGFVLCVIVVMGILGMFGAIVDAMTEGMVNRWFKRKMAKLLGDEEYGGK